jgi:nucleoside-diphosphate-sugar epimerase
MKFFVTGASGYIGGSVARRLLDAGHQVAGLVRSEEKARLLKERGIELVSGTLDDAGILADAARRADAVINAASSDHRAAVEAFLAALARSGKLYVHTSGSSIVSDDARGDSANPVAFAEDTYFEPVPERRQRVALNRMIREAGIDRGVRTVIVCPPMIYGTGRGLKAESDQIPKLIALAREVGTGVYFGKGLNRWSNVHIDDLAGLYLLAAEKAPAASFFFAENGEASFKEIAEWISHSLGFGGRTRGLDVAEAVRRFGESARFSLASNSRVRAANARRLGWSPRGPSLADVVQGRP